MRLRVRMRQRRQPARRLLGMLAMAVQHEAPTVISALLAEAMAWPDSTTLERAQKAELLMAITGLLSRTRFGATALRVAPLIPHAPGMEQVLVFTTHEERFCWRVAAAYALVRGRTPRYFPVETLVRPYREGHVSIDHAYLNRVLMRRRGESPPILLLPHPLGLVQIGGTPHLILDGNHRVVCAWRQQRHCIPGFVLTPEEGAAVLVSHTRWPPYPPQAPRMSAAGGAAAASGPPQ